MIINSQLGGKKPSGTKQITTNGTHDVAGYANADVQVPTTAPEIYRVFRNDNGELKNSISTPFMSLPSSITTIPNSQGDYCFYRCYYGTPSSVLSGAIDLSSLTIINGVSACAYMFGECTGITSADLSSVSTIGRNSFQNMFYGCSGLTSVNLSSLTQLGASACSGMFYYCSGLTSVTLTSLTTLAASACQNMFRSCTSLTSLYFPALTSSSFGTQKNQFTDLITGVTDCTIHFPSNLDPTGGSTVISSLTGYPNFGGTNTVLAFDLPATE